MCNYLFIFATLLGLLFISSPSAQAINPSLAGPPLPGGVVVTLDGDTLELQREYVLERDNTFQIKVFGLKPNSGIEVRVKFAGLGGQRQDQRADAKGNFTMLFDTPERGGSATCTVSYTAANGSSYSQEFKMRVE